MVTNSGEIDLNADAASFDRENEVIVVDSSESKVNVGVPESVEFRVQDHELFWIGYGEGSDGSVNRECDVMICGNGREGFDHVVVDAEHVDRGCDAKSGNFSNELVNEDNRSIVKELSYVQNEPEHEGKSGVTKNGSTSIEVELNKEAQEHNNAKVAFGDEGDGNGHKCVGDEMANRGDGASVSANFGSVVEDECMIKAADNKDFKEGLGDFCALRIAQSPSQLQDSIPQMEVNGVDIEKTSEHEAPDSSIHLNQVKTSYEQPSFEVLGQAEVIQSQTLDINNTGTLLLENIQNECHDFNLVVDLNPYRNLVEVDMNRKLVSSELNFCVSDLVWGKVRGHPWWPGQIFGPSAASEKAKKHFKKDSYLIAYFGDQTFAWNDGSKIKPFQMHFSQMEKQSNLENFHYAVDCALSEVSRRVEFGLSCPCMSGEVFTKLKTQLVTNAGIQKHARRRHGGDRFLNAVTFEPINLVNFVKLLAQSPLIESDRLDLAIARAQLSAFHHSKGYSQLPELIMNDELVENDMEILLMGEKGQYDYQIDRQKTDIGFSHKRKDISREQMKPRKKQRSLSDLMSDKCLCSPSNKQILETEDDDRSVSHSPFRKRKAPDDDISGEYYQNSLNRKLMQLQYVSVDEMWSLLRLAATNPSSGGHLSSMVDFFAEFKNFISPHKSASLELCEDSYWTDRIIQSLPGDQSFLENQNEREEGSPSSEPNIRSEPLKLEHFEESKEEICPAALILEFTNLDSVPSESNLNKIFGRFGPLIESQTELLKKSRRARVVFKRLRDAEIAFSSAGKYSIFGPSLFRYHLKVMPPSSSQKATVTKQ